MLTLLVACAATFPCPPGQLLAADGTCVSGGWPLDTAEPADTARETSEETGAGTDDTAPQDADGDGSTADEDCDGYVDEDVPDLLFDLADPRQAVWGLGADGRLTPDNIEPPKTRKARRISQF